MRIQANGIDIYCEIEGSGPWITLSHSLACDHSMWDAQAAALAERYTVLRFDTRGHGRSGVPPGPYDFGQLAGDVMGLLDALGVKQTHFVGISLGGMIAQHVALRAPQRLLSLVLAHITSRYPPDVLPMWEERIRIVSAQGMEPMVEPTLARWFTEPYRKAHPDVMARIAALIRATPVAGFVGCCHAIPAIDVTARLRTLKLPALVLVGEQDAGTPPSMAREIHEAIAGSRLEIIPEAAHLSNIEQAETFNRLLLGFLGQQSG